MEAELSIIVRDKGRVNLDNHPKCFCTLRGVHIQGRVLVLPITFEGQRVVGDRELEMDEGGA